MSLYSLYTQAWIFSLLYHYYQLKLLLLRSTIKSETPRVKKITPKCLLGLEGVTYRCAAKLTSPATAGHTHTHSSACGRHILRLHDPYRITNININNCWQLNSGCKDCQSSAVEAKTTNKSRLFMNSHCMSLVVAFQAC